MRSSIILGIGAWQLVMIATVLVSSEAAGHRFPLVGVHVGLMVLALLVRQHRLPLWTFATALNVMMLVDWNTAVSVNGPLALATAWMCNIAQTLPAMLMTGLQSRFFATAIGLGVPVGLYVVQPDWLETLVIASVVTGLAIRFIGRRAVPVLDDFARMVDAEGAAVEREHRAVAAVRAASFDSAEQARTLHDTAVNTLAAVASGGGAIRDAELVRARCRRDAATVQLLIDGFDTLVDQLDFPALTEGLGLALSRRGITDDELLLVSASLPEDVVRGLVGAAREALINVGKHAGTLEAEVAITIEDRHLRVVITDRGAGFGGHLVPGRGLAESVVARATTAGIHAAVESSPGQGTRVRLTYPLIGLANGEDKPEDFMDTVLAVRRRAGWLWFAAVPVIGVVIEMVNRFGMLSPTYGMLAVVVLAGAVAWRDERAGRNLSALSAAVVIACVPAAFLLAFAGTDFGEGAVINWQCFGASVPLVLLLDHGRTRLPLLLGVIGLVASTIAATVVIAADSAQVATVVPVGASPALLIIGGWLVFHRTLEQVGRRAAAEQRAAAVVRLELVRREAASASRERWRQAGLRGALALLHRLADGSLDPASQEARAECAEEESYLRQVTLLNPDLLRMGHWFVRALAEAREREVRLSVRAGSVDVESDDAASDLGAMVLRSIETAPRDSVITVSLFPSRDQLRLGLVGPGPLRSVAEGHPMPRGWTLSAQSIAETDIIEVVRQGIEQPAAPERTRAA